MTRTYRTGQVNVDETNDLLKKFWELDAIGIRDNNIRAMTKNETKAMEQRSQPKYLRTVDTKKKYRGKRENRNSRIISKWPSHV